MTGQSKTQERLQLIQEWQNKQVDIVVANSALGLGIDRSDVRAIIPRLRSRKLSTVFIRKWGVADEMEKLRFL